MDYIKSVYYDQHKLLKDIIRLHCKTDIELDPTYSTGGFYKKGVAPPKYKFDILPKRSDIVQADARHLPLPDSCISTMIIDFPFLATKGKSLEERNDKNNKTVRRFGWYPSETRLFELYKDSFKEAYRVLNKDGILIFKIQPKVSSGKQYMSHVYCANYADKAGLYFKDEFILVAKNRMVPEWQTKRQQHARKFHSYFMVFQKKNVNLGVEKY